MATLLTSIRFHSTLANGADNAAGKVYTYVAGTTTLQATYTDAGGLTPNANPVILDSTGRADIWVNPALGYKFSVQDSAGVATPDGTVDGIGPSGSSTLAADLANTSDVSKGDALIGVKRTFTGALATTEHAWHEAQIIDLVADMLADNTGAADCTAKFQTAISAGNVRIGPGAYTMSWAALSADISIPANRKIIVEKGATITMTGGRFTADTVTNVDWQIDGWVKSVAMRTAASKPLWTGSAGERGFIEFGFNYVAGTAGSGFRVHGSGIVSGDWVGTPNFSDFATQVNRKGIACWNASNVLVDGLEVFGFDGEAVYAAFFDEASNNIIFQNNNVHDTRFNALNFNNGANGGNVAIRNNRAVDTYQVEIANGVCEGNYIENTISYGIFQGIGEGGAAGPLIVRNNTVKNSGITAIAALNAPGFSTPQLVVEDNLIINAGQYSILTDYCNDISIKKNTCVGTGTIAGGYDIGIQHCLRGAVSDNTFMQPGGFAAAGRVIVDANTFDVAIDPVTNVYIPTTGTATPSGNQFGVIAAAATITIPVLGSYFIVTGGTGINTITATGCNGREITLVFQSTPTLTDGSNLKLAGNFVAGADDTITLICDGTSWYEVCRSVN